MVPETSPAEMISGLIRDIPDFPKPGVVFKDITPLLSSPGGFSAAIVEMVSASPRSEEVDLVVGMEARGFIFAAPVALAMGAGFVPVRKPGKLPAQTTAHTYDLEYGTDTLEIHSDAIKPGQRVLLVDDVLATGGTAVAAAELIRQLGGEVVGVTVMMELGFLEGAKRLEEAGLPAAKAIIHV